MKDLHKRIIKDKNEFARASVCALVIGIADLMATGTDILWLVGDMNIQTHAHHYPVMIGLVSAELVMAASFIWLYMAIHRYLTSKDKKRIRLQKEQQERIQKRNYQPHFCGQSNKGKVNHLKGVYEFED